MSERLKSLYESVRAGLGQPLSSVGQGVSAGASAVVAGRRKLLVLGLAGLGVWVLYSHPPMETVGAGELGVRIDTFSGSTREYRQGSVLVIPGLHELHRYPLRDQVYRPTASSRANGAAPFQSVEGLSLGMDIALRYALDPSKVASMARNLPDEVGSEIVEPAAQGVIYKVLARYTVREIFSSKRAEIQQTIESELKPRLAADGVLLKNVQIGKVDLPADYRAGMEKLLAEELETEKMRYTLDLKEKRVKETALEAEADKVRREKAAEAAGNEQIIAARAQEEAMKHVLPFKQRQIEQRQLEAEADKVARIRTAEGSAQARRIEAAGEADSRLKLADAEVYRMERIGKTASEQMARDGALLSKHPLLIQKTMADKLSDKVSVIIAPPPADGGFIGSALLGVRSAGNPSATAPQADVSEQGAE